MRGDAIKRRHLRQPAGRHAPGFCACSALVNPDQPVHANDIGLYALQQFLQ